ncbi:hypothetical protein AM571_CH02650 [Rhizobium etli 8C-3]|uniref:Uncharacterized protein n=1 Tax=Rhizobium etli 8C-3 TaxID=538025 RepID=A0A1L5P5Q3_RHIET|nr:hypothetical protein AM571_CH02650 [Rhizobium etli 8C-3]
MPEAASSPTIGLFRLGLSKMPIGLFSSRHVQDGRRWHGRRRCCVVPRVASCNINGPAIKPARTEWTPSAGANLATRHLLVGTRAAKTKVTGRQTGHARMNSAPTRPKITIDCRMNIGS